LEVLAKTALEWRWVIAGDGPERPSIESKIVSLGLQERVHLTEHVNYFQLPELYQQADIYLQPSLSEPWGLAVNEAMAAGLPVLVSNKCGCREDLVREGINGLLFDPEQPDSLSRALNDLLQARQKWKAMGQASQEIVSRWGLDLYAENFWKACDSAVQSSVGKTKDGVVGHLMRLAL
jgi:glycosyltransferase involved in cell wall biosynthesis